MATYRLRWLTFLGLLGLLGWVLNQPLFYALFGLFVFVPLFWYDERSESVFRRAASISFVVGVVAFAGTFGYLGTILGPGSQKLTGFDRIGVMGTALTLWGLTYGFLLVTFALSYIYLERKGT